MVASSPAEMKQVSSCNIEAEEQEINARTGERWDRSVWIWVNSFGWDDLKRVFAVERGTGCLSRTVVGGSWGGGVKSQVFVSSLWMLRGGVSLRVGFLGSFLGNSSSSADLSWSWSTGT